jgi:hypothetical protein
MSNRTKKKQVKATHFKKGDFAIWLNHCVNLTGEIKQGYLQGKTTILGTIGYVEVYFCNDIDDAIHMSEECANAWLKENKSYKGELLSTYGR